MPTASGQVTIFRYRKDARHTPYVDLVDRETSGRAAPGQASDNCRGDATRGALKAPGAIHGTQREDAETAEPLPYDRRSGQSRTLGARRTDHG
jgi:hypothetical protein